MNTECVATVPEGRALLVTVRFASRAAQSSVTVASIPADGRGGTLMFAGASVVAGGATVTFTATPAAGWYVFAWQGDGAGCSAEEAECARTADKDLFVTVRFEEAARVEYGEIPPDQSGGTLTAPIPSGGVTIRGSMLTFLATPAAGWYVAGWSRGDCVNAGAAASPGIEKECVVTAEADTLVTVTFAEVPTAGTTLRAEILKPKADSDWELARAMLEAGADPDLEVDGNPALVAAAARGHAEIVSVLVTFGANVTARLPGRGSVGRQVPHLAAINNGEANRAPSLYYSWGTALNVLRHFTDAVNQVRAPYPWAATASDFLFVGADGSTPMEGQFRAVELLEFRYRFNYAWPGESAAERKRAMVRMTDILRGQGERCEAPQILNHITCRGSKGTLLEEIQEATPKVATVSLYLSQGADPDFVDTTGVPVLITSAVLGLAEIVSALITAGADMRATDPTSNDWDVVQHMASPLSAPAAGPRAKRARILYDFGALLDARNTDFKWNREDAGGKRALDLLAEAEDAAPGLAGENVTVIYEMADYLLARGANCGANTADKTRRVCAGDMRVSRARTSLVAEVQKATGDADATVVADLLGVEGVHPDVADANNTPLLIVAATLGHAEIVSVLVTAGANVNAVEPLFGATLSLDIVQHMASALSASAPAGSRALRASVLYYFGDGLDVRGDANFDWNRENANGDRAMDLLIAAEDAKPRPVGENVTVIYEMADYLRARGAACGGTADNMRRICAGPRDCPAANRAISGDEDPRACGDCMAGYGAFGETGDLCAAKETGDFGGIAQDVVCEELRGDLKPEGEGAKTVCSGVDSNDTFCILDSEEGFPCRGLLRHVLRCNVGFERPALNPFFCGTRCAGQKAVGKDCVSF